MKKFILVLLALLFCVIIVGCDNTGDVITSITTSQTSNNITTQATTSIWEATLSTTTQSSTTTKTKKDNKNPNEGTGMSIDYSFIKEFKTIKQYKQEFLAYKSFNDIKKSVGYKYHPDNHLKIDKSYASMMLKDKFFLVLNNKFKLKKINFQLDWAYVMFHYEINSKEVVIGYCTSKEMAKGYSFFKEKPDIITEDGRELHLTKHTPPQYHWYDEELETAFCVESELFNDEDVLLECINDLTIEKINIV